MDKRNRHAVIVRNAAEAIAACRAATAHRRSVLAISPPGAASFAGPIWFKALAAAARKATGARREILFALDCADAPGAALAAIHAGVEAIVFRGKGQARAKIEAIAEAAGVPVLVPPREAPGMSRNPGSTAPIDRFSSRGAALQRPRPSAKRTATTGAAPTRSGSAAKPPPRGANRP